MDSEGKGMNPGVPKKPKPINPTGKTPPIEEQATSNQGTFPADDREAPLEAGEGASTSRTGRIRNSTAEFLIFTNQAGEGSIEVRVAEETVWLTPKLIAGLFEKGRSTIVEHLKAIFASGELDEKTTCRNFRQVGENGKEYLTKFYNLDAIIAVGFRANSERAIRFRQWATDVLRDFAIKGYALDRERLKNGAFFSKDYFDHLISEIREIRASERNFYQKITDIYATAMDYSKDAEVTKEFFSRVQNKMHYAVHGHTAAEIIVERADRNKSHMGLTNWKDAPSGKIQKPDVSIAKNYLSEPELKTLFRIVGMYLDYAEAQAERNIPLTMSDWANKLNAFLQFNDREILNSPGRVSQAVAKAFAESEFEQYRVIQDRHFESDFDRHFKELRLE